MQPDRRRQIVLAVLVVLLAFVLVPRLAADGCTTLQPRLIQKHGARGADDGGDCT